MGRRLSAISYGFKKANSKHSKAVKMLKYVVLTAISVIMCYMLITHYTGSRMPSDSNYLKYQEIANSIVNDGIKDTFIPDDVKVSFFGKDGIKKVEVYNKYTLFSVIAEYSGSTTVFSREQNSERFATKVAFVGVVITTIIFIFIYFCLKIIYSITSFFVFFFGDFMIYYKEKNIKSKNRIDFDDES